MKKFIYVNLFTFLLVIFAAFSIKANASTYALKNWQQDEPSVPGYVHDDQTGTWWYKVYDGGNFGDTGCGIMSLVNAVHYATGNFMDPLEIADWAFEKGYYSGSWGTDRSGLYPNVTAKFGTKYGFKISNTGTYGQVSDAAFINHLKSGGTCVVHVKGHFMAIVDYNETTKRYLLWDNCAGDGRGGHRAGATHKAGDWYTAEQLEGSINAEYLKVDWYCFVASTESTNVEYKQTSGYESIVLGASQKVSSGTLTNATTVSLSDSKGMMLTANGWHGSTLRIKEFGYSIDGGAIVYDPTFSVTADQSVQNSAVAKLGNSAYSSKFSVSIPLNDNKAHTFKIYAKDGTNETLIWNITKKMDGTYTENSYYIENVKKFTESGTKYSVRIYQNSTSDSSYTNGWGGSDGISDKTLSKDGVLYILGGLNMKSECKRIGLLVDNSYIVWPENKIVRTTVASSSDYYLSAGYSLGANGLEFSLKFDTSTLEKGSHKLKLVADLGGTYCEIGTKTATYGGNCFVINATSSGSKYTAENVPAKTATPTATPKATLTPKATATQKASDVTSSSVPMSSATASGEAAETIAPDETNLPSETEPNETPDATKEILPDMPTQEVIETEEPVNSTDAQASESEAPENTIKTDETTKGCFGTIGSSSVVIILLGAAFILRKKGENRD